MTYGQYCRVETAAGGIGCTPRAFVRAARSLLSPEGKSRARRDWRHAWIRAGFDHLAQTRAMLNRFKM